MKYLITTDRLPFKYPKGQIIISNNHALKALVAQGEAEEIYEKKNHDRKKLVGIKGEGPRSKVVDVDRRLELWRNDTEYDVVIYQEPDFSEVEEDHIKLLDTCIIPDRLFLKHCKGIIVPTQHLKNNINTKLNITVIKNGYYLEEQRIKRQTKFNRKVNIIGKITKEISKVLDYELFKRYSENIDEYCLTVIMDKELDNRNTIDSYMRGIPVAVNLEQVEKFINPEERKKEMERVNLKNYDIQVKADEYYNLAKYYKEIYG